MLEVPDLALAGVAQLGGASSCNRRVFHIGNTYHHLGDSDGSQLYFNTSGSL